MRQSERKPLNLCRTFESFVFEYVKLQNQGFETFKKKCYMLFVQQKKVRRCFSLLMFDKISLETYLEYFRLIWNCHKTPKFETECEIF